MTAHSDSNEGWWWITHRGVMPGEQHCVHGPFGTPHAALAWADDHTDGLGIFDTIEHHELDNDPWPDEGPTCSICDGLGHGYPGGPPCPLEGRGAGLEPEDPWL